MASYNKIDGLKKENQAVFKVLKKDVETYREKLDKFSDNIVSTILKKMYLKNEYRLSGKLSDSEDDIGKLLNNIPSPGILSLPEFLSQVDNQGYHFEIVNLKYGYLFIHLKDDDYFVQLHVCKPDEFNQYLDIRKTFKQTLPAIVRNSTIVGNEAFDVIRIAKLFIK